MLLNALMVYTFLLFSFSYRVAIPTPNLKLLYMLR